MTTHDCPGGCGRSVDSHLLACAPCWFVLPPKLRSRVWQAYRNHGPGSPEHSEVVADALRFYRERVTYDPHA